MNNDYKVLRELANRYFEMVNSDTNRQNVMLHKGVNDLKMIRPTVLIEEIPWHEMNIGDELTCVCEDPYLREVEWEFRTNLYKWKYMPADTAYPNYFKVQKVIHTTGIGLATEHDTENENADTKSHVFEDQLKTEADLEKLHNHTITYDEAETKRRYELAANVFGDILPVKIVGEAAGYDLGCKNWDDIVFLRGLDNIFFDLVERPEFLHKTVAKLTDIFLDKVRQYEELNLIDGDAYYNHGTSALTNDLKPDHACVKAKDVWGRGIAQIFAMVSPEMHDEFDTQYMIRAMEPFGMTYYGCCEPLDKKVHILEQIKNLRKISITPWADINIAAEVMGSRYVVAAKPTPAALASATLNHDAVRAELTGIVDACVKNNCSFELVLKDITTVSGKPQNLFEWEKIAMEIVRNV